MKKRFLVSSIICLGATALRAQESELESLKKALQDQQKIIQSLLKKVEELEKQQASVTNQQAELKQLVQISNTNVSVAATTNLPAAPRWSPTDPIRLPGGLQNYVNVSFDGLFAAGTSTAEDI